MKYMAIILILVLSGCATNTQQNRTPEYIKMHGYDHLAIEMVEKLKNYNYTKHKNSLFIVEKTQLKDKSFCFVGDTGNGSSSQKKISMELYKSCDRIFHMGDIIYPLGMNSKNDPELKEKFLDFYAPFKAPFYLTMGNHDYLNMEYNVEPWIELAESYDKLFYPHPYYGINLSGVCLVSLDSIPIEFSNKVPHLAKEQARWLKYIEENELKNCQTKIVFTHYPYRTPYTRRDKKAIGKGWRLKFYEDHIIGKYDLLFSGHDHILSYVGNFKGTDQYITGAGGKYTSEDKIKKFDSIHKKLHRGPGFIKMTFKSKNPKEFIIETIAFEGKELQKKVLVHKKSY